MAPCDLIVKIDKSRTGGTFTNYDVISGKVYLKVRSEITLSFIEVKLEGISKTVIEVPKATNKKNRKKTELHAEVHKLLYDTTIVFPPKDVRKVSSSKEFTLIPGDYTYPFQFTIPLSNRCSSNKSVTGLTNKFHLVNGFSSSHGNLSGPSKSGISYVSEASRHVESILPPSVTGLKDFATVQYFVKATANRPSIFKGNLRGFDPFVFLPIDNIPPPDGRESFFRKRFILENQIPHTVAMGPRKPAPAPSRGIFHTLFYGSDPSPSSSRSPKVSPKDLPFYLEARFGYPAFLVPTKKPTFALFLVSKHHPDFFALSNKQSSGLGQVYLRSLEIYLMATTTVVVKGHIKDVRVKEPVLYLTGLDHELDFVHAKKSKMQDRGEPMYQVEFPRKLLKRAVLPDHIAPSFKSCNITRAYEMVLKVGISGSDHSETVEMGFDISVLSGMEPPEQQVAPAAVLQALDSPSNESFATAQGMEAGEGLLPTYDEVMGETDNSRRRYEQSEFYCRDVYEE